MIFQADAERAREENTALQEKLEKSQGEVYRLKAKLENAQGEQDSLRQELDKSQSGVSRIHADRDKVSKRFFQKQYLHSIFYSLSAIFPMKNIIRQH